MFNLWRLKSLDRCGSNAHAVAVLFFFTLADFARLRLVEIMPAASHVLPRSRTVSLSTFDLSINKLINMEKMGGDEGLEPSTR